MNNFAPFSINTFSFMELFFFKIIFTINSNVHLPFVIEFQRRRKKKGQLTLEEACFLLCTGLKWEAKVTSLFA